MRFPGKNFVFKRSTKYGISTTLLVALIVFIVISMNVLVIYNNKRLDLTENRLYTLSPHTLKVLRGLKNKLTITSFFEKGYPDREKIEDLLNAYLTKTKMIEAKVIDPDKNPGLAKKYDLNVYGVSVVEGSGRTIKVYDVSEEGLTNAIIKSNQDKEKEVYFLQGHGEGSIEGFTKADYLSAKTALENEGYWVKELNLNETGKIPLDCSVLVVSPRKPLINREMDLIAQYLKQGGGGFFLLDPFPFPELTSFLSNWGVNLEENIIVDPSSKLFGGDISMPVITHYQELHEITAHFKLPTLFPVARSVTPQEKVPDGLEVLSLAYTNPKSWAEFGPKKKKEGPLSLAIAVSHNSKADKNRAGTRMVVVGDSDFATNSFIRFSGNRDFFLNCLNWLAQDEELISIRPKTVKMGTINLTQRQGDTHLFLTMIVFPTFILIPSAFVWLRRRRQ